MRSSRLPHRQTTDFLSSGNCNQRMSVIPCSPRFMHRSLWLLAATVLGACSGASNDGGRNGVGGSGLAGSESTGGSITGSSTPGSSVGSAATGGSTTGNAATGGTATGGTVSTASPTGGAATGGKANGGSATGGAATGGKSNGGNSTGGALNGGSPATGGKANGGSSPGGAATGGKANGGNSTGGALSGGSPTTGGSAAGGATSTSSAFGQCRFHFGTNDSYLKSNTAMRAEMDYYQPGWMGTNGDTFDQSYVCTYAASGNAMANLVPVVVSYIAAGYAKRHHSLCDCNVSGCSNGDLCKSGAQYINQDWSAILTEYQSFANGYATNCNGLGTTRPIIFKMEPDWYQYTISNQSAPWTAAQAGSKMTELVNTLKAKLPLARFAVDVSPWVGSNGKDNGASWYSNFNMGLFTFIATSGGGTSASTSLIRGDNLMTWSGLNSVTGKAILADTGYGANGGSAGHDAAWDVVSNINSRIADGVVAITQYNPNSNWGTTISGIRSQLSAPKYCP